MPSMMAKVLYVESVFAFRKHKAHILSELASDRVKAAAKVLHDEAKAASLKLGQEVKIVVSAEPMHAHVDFRGTTLMIQDKDGNNIVLESIR